MGRKEGGRVEEREGGREGGREGKDEPVAWLLPALPTDQKL